MVKLSAALFHDESSITIGGYESAIVPINRSLTALSIIEGFHKPLRLNISDKSGGLLVHVRLHLLSHQLTKFKIPSDSSKSKS